MKTKAQQKREFILIRKLIEDKVNGVVCEFTFGDASKGVVVLEPHDEGQNSFYRAEEVINIANAFRVSSYVSYGHPPTDHEGATEPALYIAIF